MKSKNVVVFLPMAGDSFSISRDTFISYNQAKDYLMANQQFLPFKIGSFVEYYPNTFPIDANRNECAHRAIDGIKLADGKSIKPDITIWLDMDHIFPSDCLFNLLKHNLPIVCGVYHLKAKRQGKAFFPVIFKRGKDYEKTKMYKPIIQYPEDELFKIDFTGLGCMAVWTEVFETLANGDKKFEFFKYQEHSPYAPDDDAEWKAKHGIKDVSEDEYFWAFTVDNTDYDIWCDPAIQCGHIGRMVYNKPMYDAFLEQHRAMFIEMHGEEEFNKRWATVYKMEKSAS